MNTSCDISSRTSCRRATTVVVQQKDLPEAAAAAAAAEACSSSKLLNLQGTPSFKCMVRCARTGPALST